MPTKPTQFRLTDDEVALLDDLVGKRGCESRVALLRLLVAEDAARFTYPSRPSVVAVGAPAAPPVSTLGPRPQSGGGPYMDVHDCPHPIGRRLGKACGQCGKDPA